MIVAHQGANQRSRVGCLAVSLAVVMTMPAPATALAQHAEPPPSKAPTVLLDCYFNNEWREDAAGRPARFHYVWGDSANSGFSILGGIIRRVGGDLDLLCESPTLQSLKPASVYVIVDPDTPRETEHPNVIGDSAIDAIASWVSTGGALVLMGNDSGNVELSHFNRLVARFGMRFNGDSRNRVIGKNHAVGTFDALPDHPLFRGVGKIFIKELSTLRLDHPAVALLADHGDVIIGSVRVGKGIVIAVGDPWFYNEYMDSRRLPEGYGNARAAENLFRWLLPRAGEQADLIIDGDGGGDERSIQAALDALDPRSPAPVVLLLRNGLYNEKVFIRRSHVSLVGEDRDSTRIVWPELRESWNRDHNGSDWGAGVVNIDTGVTDVTLANLTVANDYGRRFGVWNKHQFAVRGAGTRIMLLNAVIRSDGGDALSLWNRDNGMYYHADCSFEGWVDFVCPRGWCYVTRSRFFGHNTPSASIWHDGSGDRRQKFVITDSYFDGVPGFPLGRNHRDAQFYLVNCRFSERMADRPFTRPPSSPREWQWGDRHYFSGCRRDGGDYAWFRDNCETADPPVEPASITAAWTFDGMWDPEDSMPSILPHALASSPRHRTTGVDPAGVRLAWTAGRNALSHNVHLGTSTPPPFRGNQTATGADTGTLEAGVTYFWRVDEVTPAGVVRGETREFTTR